MTPGFDSNSSSADDNALVEIADGTTTGPSKPRVKVGEDFRAYVDFPRTQVYDFIHASNWMGTASVTEVEMSVLGSVTTLDFFEYFVSLGTATVTFTDTNGWDLSMIRYIADDDGAPLQDDDSTFLNLD